MEILKAHLGKVKYPINDDFNDESSDILLEILGDMMVLSSDSEDERTQYHSIILTEAQQGSLCFCIYFVIRISEENLPLCTYCLQF